MAKGQSAQVYVVTGLVFFFGIVIGFKMVYDFMQKSADVRYEDFKVKLKADIKAVSVKQGAVTKVSYVLPYEGKELCFYQAGSTMPENRYIRQLITDGNNAFLLSGTNVRAFQVASVTVADGYHCFASAQGRVTFLLEGADNKALVRQSS